MTPSRTQAQSDSEANISSEVASHLLPIPFPDPTHDQLTGLQGGVQGDLTEKDEGEDGFKWYQSFLNSNYVTALQL